MPQQYQYPEDDPESPVITYEDIQYLNDLDKGFIGLEAPQIERTILTRRDEYNMRRRADASVRFGIPLHELPEEPDGDVYYDERG